MGWDREKGEFSFIPPKFQEHSEIWSILVDFSLAAEPLGLEIGKKIQLRETD